MFLYEIIKFFDYFNFLGTPVIVNNKVNQIEINKEVENINKHVKNIVSLEKELHEYFKTHNIKFE